MTLISLKERCKYCIENAKKCNPTADSRTQDCYFGSANSITVYLATGQTIFGLKYNFCGLDTCSSFDDLDIDFDFIEVVNNPAFFTCNAKDIVATALYETGD